MSRAKCSAYTCHMAETFDSVLDRIGAFNAATEAMAKAGTSEVQVQIVGHDGVRLRLTRTEDNYAIEVHGPVAEPALTSMGFKPQSGAYMREVRKSERSWNVASQLEDILQDALALGPAVSIEVHTS